MSRYAWVTLATNDTYSLGALVLAYALKGVQTKYELAAMVTPGVTPSMRSLLEGVFDNVYNVDIMNSNDEQNLLLLRRPELGVTFTKLHCWRLTQYSKCVFLDADVLVLKNCDELFDREELSAAPDVGWPDCFNSGVFVYRPSNETYANLVKFALERRSFDGGDQGLLNLYFSGWAHKDIHKHLPFIYNMCSIGSYSYLPAFKEFGDQVRIVHFIGSSKPWLQHFNTNTLEVSPSENFRHLKVVLQHWWDLFCSQVHYKLSPTMSGLAGVLSQVTLGDPSSPQSRIIEEQLRRQDWEVGNIDYLGRDSFDNIWKKICETVDSASNAKKDITQVEPVVPVKEVEQKTPPSAQQISKETSDLPKAEIVEQPQPSEKQADILTKEKAEVSKEEPKVSKQEELISKQEEPVSKQEEPVSKQEEPVSKQEEPVSKQEELVSKQEEPVSKQEKPVSKREELVSTQEEPVSKQEEPVSKQEEPKVSKQEEPKLSKQEELVSKQEEPQISKPEEPQVSKEEEPKVSKPEELASKKEEPKVTKQEELVSKQEELVSKQEEPQISKLEEPQVSKPEEPKVSKQEELVSKQEEPKVSKQEEPKISKQEEPKVSKQEGPQVSKKVEPQGDEKTTPAAATQKHEVSTPEKPITIQEAPQTGTGQVKETPTATKPKEKGDDSTLEKPVSQEESQTSTEQVKEPPKAPKSKEKEKVGEKAKQEKPKAEASGTENQPPVTPPRKAKDGASKAGKKTTKSKK